MSGYWQLSFIGFGFAVLFGGLTWALVKAFQRTQSTTKRVLIGIFLAVFGLIALGCTACGLMFVGA